MKCPFCGGAMTAERDADLGEGETGGRARARDHRCTTCEVVLAEMRIDKIGSAQETWRIESPPRAERVVAPASSRATPCARCGGLTIVAMPEGHVPAPAHALGSMRARLEVMTDTCCVACGAIGQFFHG